MDLTSFKRIVSLIPFLWCWMRCCSCTTYTYYVDIDHSPTNLNMWFSLGTNSTQRLPWVNLGRRSGTTTAITLQTSELVEGNVFYAGSFGNSSESLQWYVSSISITIDNVTQDISTSAEWPCLDTDECCFALFDLVADSVTYDSSSPCNDSYYFESDRWLSPTIAPTSMPTDTNGVPLTELGNKYCNTYSTNWKDWNFVNSMSDLSIYTGNNDEFWIKHDNSDGNKVDTPWLVEIDTEYSINPSFFDNSDNNGDIRGLTTTIYSDFSIDENWGITQTNPVFVLTDQTNFIGIKIEGMTLLRLLLVFLLVFYLFSPAQASFDFPGFFFVFVFWQQRVVAFSSLEQNAIQLILYLPYPTRIT